MTLHFGIKSNLKIIVYFFCLLQLTAYWMWVLWTQFFFFFLIYHWVFQRPNFTLPFRDRRQAKSLRRDLPEGPAERKVLEWRKAGPRKRRAMTPVKLENPEGVVEKRGPSPRVCLFSSFCRFLLSRWSISFGEDKS